MVRNVSVEDLQNEVGNYVIIWRDMKKTIIRILGVKILGVEDKNLGVEGVEGVEGVVVEVVEDNKVVEDKNLGVEGAEDKNLDVEGVEGVEGVVVEVVEDNKVVEDKNLGVEGAEDKNLDVEGVEGVVVEVAEDKGDKKRLMYEVVSGLEKGEQFIAPYDATVPLRVYDEESAILALFDI